MFGLKERQLNFHHGQFNYIYTLTIAYQQYLCELALIICSSYAEQPYWRIAYG